VFDTIAEIFNINTIKAINNLAIFHWLRNAFLSFKSNKLLVLISASIPAKEIFLRVIRFRRHVLKIIAELRCIRE
jgi:hypothetical protein